MQAIGYTHGSISTLLNGVGQSLVFGDVFQSTVIDGFQFTQTAPYEFTIGPGTAYIGLGRAMLTTTTSFSVPSGANYTLYLDLDYLGNWTTTTEVTSVTGTIPPVATNNLRIYVIGSNDTNGLLTASFVAPTGINLANNVNNYINDTAQMSNLTYTYAGTPSESETIFNMTSVGTPFNMANTWMDCVCTCSTAPTANTVFTGYFNSPAIGEAVEAFTISFIANQTKGSFSFILSSAPSLPADGNITIVAPSNSNSIANININLVGTVCPTFSFTYGAPVLKYSNLTAAPATIPSTTNVGDLIVVISAEWSGVPAPMPNYNTIVSYGQNRNNAYSTGFILQWKIATVSDIGASITNTNTGADISLMIFEQGSFNPINPICNYSVTDQGTMIPFDTYNYNTMIFMYGGDRAENNMQPFEPAANTTIIYTSPNYTLQYYTQQNPGIIPTYTNGDNDGYQSFLVFAVR